MGIKGRRKRQREREQRVSAEAGQRDHDGEDDADAMPKMKKSELYKLLDEDYLERLHDEHVQRRQSHMLRRKRDPDEEVRTLATELLQEQEQTIDDEDVARDKTHARGGDARTTDALTAARRGTKATAAATAGSFDDPLLGLHPAVVDALAAEGFARMTLIQERSIPYLLEGCDVLGQARTGSGKTLAFCIPILHRLETAVPLKTVTTQALLMAPTKELCVQTHDVLQRLVAHLPRPSDVIVRVITGGTKVSEERRWLVAGTTIVVGTPGRVHDHAVHCTTWQLSCVQWLVLDEADRMLAEGFKKDLDAILSRLPSKRQTCLFSATNSRSVHELARLSLSRTPLFVSTNGDRPALLSQTENAVQMAPYRRFTITTGEEDDGAARQNDAVEDTVGANNDAQQPIPSTLQQYCHIFPLEDRLLQLYVFVKRVARRSKAMVFCSTVASTTFHFQMMGSVGFHDDVMMLHGHMKHRQRVQAFRVFREWETGVLFCTDVAARGLDIPHVDWILQYDPPLDPTEYIHRIGRTARAGNVGSALLFLAPEEAGFVPYLHKYGIYLAQYPAAPATLPAIQEKLEHVLQLDPIVAKSAVVAYRAHVGAYQSHILKETFDVHRLDLGRLARAFALSAAPHVTLPKNSAEEKKREYVKGRLKSLNRRRTDAFRHYEAMKTKQQWDGGVFVGIAKPSV